MLITSSDVHLIAAHENGLPREMLSLENTKGSASVCHVLLTLPLSSHGHGTSLPSTAALLLGLL